MPDPTATPPMQWVPLSELGARFDANLKALSSRDPALSLMLGRVVPARQYQIAVASDQVVVGTAHAGTTRPLPARLPAAAARKLIAGLYPAGRCDQPLLVAGEDLGWLLDGVYRLPCDFPQLPGHRPPLFFLAGDLEQLWVILHLQDWQRLLTDPRVRLFAGPTAREQFQQSLRDDDRCPWPKLGLTIDPSAWAGSHFDQTLLDAKAGFDQDVVLLRQRNERLTDGSALARFRQKLAEGTPLTVLGVTSRYTTFLQYSMRDWLAALQQLGHRTHLMIESADHEIPNAQSLARACAAHQPDLIVVIDHSRPEFFHVPAHIPVVMWVQDRLPNIFNAATGRRQGRFDYAIGYSRGELTQQFEYPPSRFMPTMMAVNESRFSPAPLSESERARFRCEVSFVSHCTMPAEQIVTEEIAKANSPHASVLLRDVFERLRGEYDAGRWVTSGERIRQIINASMADNAVAADVGTVLDLFTHRVNNALFRHQAIQWAVDAGVDLHLYGNGWEAHPAFGRFARGAADNQSQLSAIYRASTINLQVTPFSAVHPRLLDGIAAGGFFLIRSVTADELELLLRDIGLWCRKGGVRGGAEMLARRDAALDRMLARYAELDAIDPAGKPDYFFAAAEEVVLSGLTRTPNTLWERESAEVMFSTREQLCGRIEHFLRNPDQREALTTPMRQRILQTHTYGAISQRLLSFIEQDLAGEPIAAAA